MIDNRELDIRLSKPLLKNGDNYICLEIVNVGLRGKKLALQAVTMGRNLEFCLLEID